MSLSNSFYQLFKANFTMMLRNYRGVFFNLALPIILYVAISKVVGLNIASGSTYSYPNYLLPGIVAMTIMQTGIFSIAYWLIDLRTSGALKRFLVTPLSPFEMVASVVTSRLALIIVQIFLLLVIGYIFFGAQIEGSFTAILILLALGGAVFLSLGFFISSFAKNYEEAAPITTVINLLFTFLGNIFFETSKFPGFLRAISKVLPVSFLSEGMRNNFLEPNWSVVQTLPNIVGLLIWLVILLTANAYLFKTKED